MQEDLKNIRSIGVVIIGRNEGERLLRCLKSVTDQGYDIVYVDSGSRDGSVACAKNYGSFVVDLDMTIPFTAARARNEGFARIQQLIPNVELVQFVDGDCELNDKWLDVASSFLKLHPEYAVVCGRLRERYPDASLFNRLCDIEWNGPVGDVNACGGIFMIRAKVFQSINGMNASIIAGEEPEMCFRLRKQGWLIYRIANDMGWHDAAMTSFRQWWKRAMRSGYAYAQGYDLHGRGGQGYCQKESIKIWFWALIPPLVVILLSVSVSPTALLLLSVYLVQFGRIAVRMNKRLMNPAGSILYGFFTVLGKWPQLIGQIMFIKRKLTRRHAAIIEYK